MATLDDTLNSAIQKRFYKSRTTGEYIKFTTFGSRNCFAEIYSPEDNIIVKRRLLLIDSPEERKKYELVPKNELPTKLKN